jgi:hypothetical protein
VETLDLKCEVCGKPAVGVCNALGPMSAAFCGECLTTNRVTYGNLVGYLYTVEPKTLDDLAEWVHPTVKETLAFYGRTWEDFVKDCADAMRSYEAYCEAEQRGDNEDLPDTF